MELNKEELKVFESWFGNWERPRGVGEEGGGGRNVKRNSVHPVVCIWEEDFGTTVRRTGGIGWSSCGGNRRGDGGGYETGLVEMRSLDGWRAAEHRYR
jgi:hypothetical protein